MNSILFRLARPEDAADILAIYAPYVRNTPITFEYEVPTLDVFKQRIRDISNDYPYFVCESEKRIVGYVYAHRHMERAAYQWNAELSIYLQEGYTQKGLGKIMCATLFRLLRLQGIRNVYSCVTIPNMRSEGLHRSLGFRLQGIFLHAGYKCGAWHDVAWFEKSIADYPHNPAPLCPFHEIETDEVRQILVDATRQANVNRH